MGEGIPFACQNWASTKTGLPVFRKCSSENRSPERYFGLTARQRLLRTSAWNAGSPFCGATVSGLLVRRCRNPQRTTNRG